MSSRYTGVDIAQSQFYQLPKFLMQGEYCKLSSDAKILYALLRDRHSLSMSSGWANDKGEIYLIFSREEMADLLGRGSQSTIRKAMLQLKAAGLVEEERQGLNKPNLIYLCKPTSNPGLSESDIQDRQIMTPNKTDNNNIISKKESKVQTLSGDSHHSRTINDKRDENTFTPMPTFPEIDKGSNVFSRTAQNHGKEWAEWALAITNHYIDKMYPRATGRKHPTLNKAQRMAFAEKFLEFVDDIALSGQEPGDIFRSILRDEGIPDPTILIATNPKILGNHGLRTGHVPYECLQDTQYCPTDDYY